jgi:hypothetical protein
MSALYVSPRCEHSRQIVRALEACGKIALFDVIDIDTVRRLPRYIDRVPTLVQRCERGNLVLVSDEGLFNMIEGLGAGTSGPAVAEKSAAQADTPSVEPADVPARGLISDTFTPLSEGVERMSNLWMLTDRHEPIDTRGAQPFPVAKNE